LHKLAHIVTLETGRTVKEVVDQIKYDNERKKKAEEK